MSFAFCPMACGTIGFSCPRRVRDDPARTNAPTQPVEWAGYYSIVVRHDAYKVGSPVGTDDTVDEGSLSVGLGEVVEPPEVSVWGGRVGPLVLARTDRDP